MAPFGIAFWVMQLPLGKAVPGQGFNRELAAGGMSTFILKGHLGSATACH